MYPSEGAKNLTAPVPVVGSVVEGVGNAPAVQKLGGKEEKPGYLGAIYNSAAGAVQTVYDAAGNVVSLSNPFHNIYILTTRADWHCERKDRDVHPRVRGGEALG